MTAQRLDGRQEAEKILSQLKRSVKKLKTKPTLATIIVGQRFDSAVYIRLKTSAAKKIGMRTIAYHLPATTSQNKLERLITRLNKQPSVSGILLQLPLPKKLKTQPAINLISPRKDVDGFHPKQTKVISPTLAGVLQLVKMGKPKRRGAAVILGRHSVLAKQLQQCLHQQGFTVTIISSNWSKWTRRADIIVTMLGRGPKLMANQINNTTVVIDVGIRSAKGKTTGDVDPKVWNVAKAISPVPGGVGPLTVAFVLKNCLILRQKL